MLFLVNYASDIFIKLKGVCKMEKLELLEAEEFDMSIQAICDPDDCNHDCAPSGNNDCGAWWTGGF
ncbi:hypothetical protein HMSSN036_45230 [Paenibacillus macerans]|nr:hypothetical protein HMSSN036_45230 [Paenibacillus macerans]